ncbi:Alpha/beta knot methyltransferase, partial [Dimargaris cristalligena]
DAAKPPCWLALDSIMDPQNLGSILRSAYFFGVDGVVVCSRNSAPLGPVVAKASSGALECVELYSTSTLPRFLKRCVETGWTTMGATCTEATDKPLLDVSSLGLSTGPTILVVGNEGEGLRAGVAEQCTKLVRVQSTNPMPVDFIDSLNVGVATGVLLHSMIGMRRDSAPASEEK